MAIASYSNFATASYGGGIASYSGVSAQPYGNSVTASYSGFPTSMAAPSASYSGFPTSMAAPSGIMSVARAPSSIAAPSGLMSMNTMGTSMMAPAMMIQQAPQMVMQQPIAEQFEIRELAEDRIRRMPAVYKTAAPFDYVERAPVAQVQYDLPGQAVDDSAQLIEALNQTLGNLTRVCILGGTAFKDECSEPLVKALADGFSAWLSDKVVVVTGGMKGVQETFAQGCAQGPAVVNMLPSDQASNFGVGVDFAAFRDLNERIEYFGQIGDIYITIEGGPGVSKEANAAFSRGAIVLPMMSTGGASNGMFDFPAGALEVQPFATPEHWELLKTKGMPEETTRAVCEIILGLLPQEQAQ